MTAFANGSTGVQKVFEPEAVAAEYIGYAERIRPYVRDTSRFLHDAIAANKRLIFEAAQGSLLDIDHGTYPYVTSSSSLPSGIWSGSGIGIRDHSGNKRKNGFSIAAGLATISEPWPM